MANSRHDLEDKICSAHDAMVMLDIIIDDVDTGRLKEGSSSMGRLSCEVRATDEAVQITSPVRIGGARKGFASGHAAPSRTAKGRMVVAVMMGDPDHVRDI